jgi:hypothetical protein
VVGVHYNPLKGCFGQPFQNLAKDSPFGGQ